MHEINLETDLLASNEEVARENKKIFDDHRIYVFNLMSAPGSGKTSLLERTIPIINIRKKLILWIIILTFSKPERIEVLIRKYSDEVTVTADNACKTAINAHAATPLTRL